MTRDNRFIDEPSLIQAISGSINGFYISLVSFCIGKVIIREYQLYFFADRLSEAPRQTKG